MQFDFVLFLFKKTFLRRKISLFSFETFVWNIFSYLYKTQLTRYSWKKLWHWFFRTIISKPTEVNGDFIRFFLLSVACSKIVSFHPAKGRPVHAVFIILSASTKTCSANWYRWPYFYCCSFWCFQLSRLSAIRDSYIHGCVNFLFYLFILYIKISYFWCSCVSVKCVIAIMVCVCVCVCVFQRSCFVPISSMHCQLLWFSFSFSFTLKWKE